MGDSQEGVDDQINDVFNSRQTSLSSPLRLFQPNAKQILLDSQVSFIVQTRDNCKPDPYGTHSTTHGPLPWPVVAKLYSQKFRIGMPAVGGAAMEKRARQHRQKWMEARPEYPREILYATKAKTEKLAKARGNGKGKVAGKAESQVELNTSLRTGGWIPPDHVRNQAGLDLYLAPSSTVDVHEVVTFEIISLTGRACSQVCIPAHIVRNTSAFVSQELEEKHGLHITLACPSKVVVERYMQCISPVQLRSLPDWDGTALVELYVIATKLEDEFVRSLVLERWRVMIERGGEVEMETADLNCIFSGTEMEDPARKLWTELICSCEGVAKMLVESGECQEELVNMIAKWLPSGNSVFFGDL
ncbi:hypothetical protein FB567DRAFT_455342 [Paraphoma chrysanthemicola]|uniref:Uncharacterized protein n=1 Tax=Paraphoma chrysanthemicola TaxID=798071 RepID=A0A8K0QUR4_9PLEO|nr:hypothetical protein FB567DRAFT_455342 [Paraphoma chrysanthemicola]